MKRILSFFMVFVLLFNFVLPRRSEAVAPVVGALLSNPKTYVAVGSLLASAGIVYENADSLKAGVTDFLNKSAQIREQVHNAMLISGIYAVNGIQKNIFPVNQELYNSAVDYANSQTGESYSSSSIPIDIDYIENDVLINSTDVVIPYNVSTVANGSGFQTSTYKNKPSSTDYTSATYMNFIEDMENTLLSSVTTEKGYIPFVRITPTLNDWSLYNNSIGSNGIYFNLLGNKFRIAIGPKETGVYKSFIIQSEGTNVYASYFYLQPYTPVYITAQPKYTSDENGVWYSGLRLFITGLVYSGSQSCIYWRTQALNSDFLRCNTPTGVSDNATYNHPEISSLFTTFDEESGLYMPSGKAIAPTVNYSVSIPTTEEWTYSADEQVGIVLPSGSIDNYVGTPESVTAGELTTYTGEKTGELDWTNIPSEDEGEEGGGSISGEFDIGKWLTGTGEGTLSGTIDNAFSNVNAKIDSLTNSISNVFNPELSWQNSNFRWFDFIILFLDVILACIRLTIRFLVFVVTLTQIVATPLISNSHMLQGIDFLKNITIPETSFTIWGLLTSFATAMIGVSAFKFIKRKFRF